MPVGKNSPGTSDKVPSMRKRWDSQIIFIYLLAARNVTELSKLEKSTHGSVGLPIPLHIFKKSGPGGPGSGDVAIFLVAP